MTTQLERQETATRAGLDVGLEKAPTAGLNAEQRAAKRIQEEMNKTTPRTTLEALKAGITIDMAKLNEDLNKSFGTIDYATGTRSRIPGTPEALRYAQANTATDKIVRTIQEGYDRLPPGEKTDTRNAIEKIINMHPDGVVLLTGLGAGKQAFLESLLRDPQYIASLKSVLDEKFKPEKLPKDVDVKLQGEVEKTDKLKTAKIRIHTDSNTELARLKTMQTEFSGIIAGKGLELHTAQNDVTRLNGEMRTIQGELDAIEIDMSDPDPVVRAAARPRYAPKRADVAKKQAELEEAKSKRDALIAEKNSLPNVVSQTQVVVDKAEEDVIEAGYQFALAKANLEAAKSNKELEEKAMAEGLEKGFEEAIRKFIDDRVTAAEQQRVKLVGEEKTKQEEAQKTAKEKAIDKAKRDIQTQLERRYYRLNNARTFMGRRINRRLSRATVNRDYTALVRNGPDFVLDRMFASVPLAQQTPEFRDLTVNNADFRKEIRQKLIAHLMAKKLEFNRISEHDAQYIVSTEWGKEAIDKAITDSEEMRNKIAELRGKGGIASMPLIEWFRDHKRLAWFLGALFGLGGLGVGAAWLVGNGGLYAAAPLAGAKIATGANSLMFGKDITNAAQAAGVSPAWTAQVAAEKHLSPVKAAALVADAVTKP